MFTPLPHLQNLVSFLNALPIGRAPFLHPRDEDAHVIAPSQLQPYVGALDEADQSGIGAVPVKWEQWVGGVLGRLAPSLD